MKKSVAIAALLTVSATGLLPIDKAIAIVSSQQPIQEVTTATTFPPPPEDHTIEAPLKPESQPDRLELLRLPL